MSIKTYMSAIALVQYASALAMRDRFDSNFAQVAAKTAGTSALNSRLVNDIVSNMAQDGVIRIPITKKDTGFKSFAQID